MSSERRWVRVGGYAVIVRNERILLCRLSQRTSVPGLWTLPGGGVEFGEHPSKATVREVREETGLVVELGELIEIDSEISIFPEGRMHSLRLIYRADSYSGELVFEAEESTDRCEWISYEDACQLPLTSLATRALQIINGQQVTSG